jgi:hypothetical protein
MGVITTSGGSGNTSQSLASGAGANLTLFTTPATANMVFLITVTVAGGSGVGTADLGGTSGPCTWNGTGGYYTSYAVAGYAGKVGSTQHIKVIQMKVGPNTPVYAPIFNSDVSTRTIYVSWNYCGVTF